MYDAENIEFRFHMFRETLDSFVVGKFNVPMFKGNINDDVNFYQSYVLKMAKINLFDRFLFFPFITRNNPILL